MFATAVVSLALLWIFLEWLVRATFRSSFRHLRNVQLTRCLGQQESVSVWAWRNGNIGVLPRAVRRSQCIMAEYLAEAHSLAD